MKKLFSVAGVIAFLHVIWHVIIAGLGMLQGSWLGWIFAITSLGLFYAVHNRYALLKQHHDSEHPYCEYDNDEDLK